MRILVVDCANVVGSRPDGWWHDRPAAARRLHERLSAAGLPYDEVVLVVEGQARAGCPEGWDGNLLTVHAPGSGDDAVAELARLHLSFGDGRSVLVVTADRALRERVEAVGAGVVGPSSLLERL